MNRDRSSKLVNGLKSFCLLQSLFSRKNSHLENFKDGVNPRTPIHKSFRRSLEIAERIPVIVVFERSKKLCVELD